MGEEGWQSHGLCCVKTEYKQQKNSSGKAVIFWAAGVAAKSVAFARKSSCEFYLIFQVCLGKPALWLLVVFWSHFSKGVCASQAVLPGVLVTVFVVMCSLLQFSSIWGVMATGYVCFW